MSDRLIEAVEWYDRMGDCVGRHEATVVEAAREHVSCGQGDPKWEKAHRLREAIFDTIEDQEVTDLSGVFKLVMDEGVVQSWVEAVGDNQENQRRVWYCEEHFAYLERPTCDYVSKWCSVVERRLVPSDAVVVCRGPDGKWPDWAVDAIVKKCNRGPRVIWYDTVPRLLDEMADALAEASRKETG